MSEEEFLARWSRRKGEARAIAAPQAGEPAAAQSAPSPPAAAGGEPEFDLSSLPPIDTITSATDITAFLRKGVPQHLTRAALRRAWAADPAIRDFVGLAENAWDFNDPSAMPGFGPLDCSEVELAAWVDTIVGGARKAAELLPDTSVEAENSADSSPEKHLAETSVVLPGTAPSPATQLVLAPAAVQPMAAENTEGEIEPARRRTHGGALPR